MENNNEDKKQKRKATKTSFEDYNSEFVPPRAAKLLTGASLTTLRKWAEANTVDAYATPTGQLFYRRQSLLDLVAKGDDTPQVSEGKSIIYARVSSKDQLDDLGRQIDLLRAQYPGADLITDVASGLNFKRKGLQTVLELAMRGELAEVVVAHKDRLCRFGSDLVQWILEKNGAKLVVLASRDEVNTASTEQELATDLLNIVHVYACKQMGRRRYKSQRQTSQEDSAVSDKASEALAESVGGNDAVRVE